MIVGQTSIDDDFKIHGLAKINKKVEVEEGIVLHPGIYPIIGFEMYSVWLPIEGKHCEVNLSRDDFEWIKVEPHIDSVDYELFLQGIE